MKLISVQSRGDRLVKIWQTGIYGNKYKVEHKFISKNIFYKAGAGTIYGWLSRALKAAENWLKGATV